MKRDIFHDEQGFSSVGMAVALLLTLALLFTAGKVYCTTSASAEIQEVADAAALAAENVVAEYMIAVRLCDAMALTLTLTGVTVTGLGVAALLVPAAAPSATQLLDAGKRLFEARDSFAEKATAGLAKLQKALPFLAAANAASVGQANSGGTAGANYLALGVLVPATGKSFDAEALPEASSLQDAIDEEADELQDEAARAEEAAQQANEIKRRAFMRDCGDNPSPCSYERAAHLAGLSGDENPLYQSVDTWSFNVAFQRARDYYEARLRNEAPLNNSVEEQANSALRTVFYEYMSEEVSQCYMADDGSCVSRWGYRNTAELRQTRLYTAALFPVSAGEGLPLLHAWSGCPAASGATRNGSLSEMEAGGWETCETCAFTAASLGKVPSASSLATSGFEYHYREIAQLALEYSEAYRAAQESAERVKECAANIFDAISEVLEALKAQRISAEPPGRAGAIAVVVNTTSTDTSGWFNSAFASDSGALGTRAAVSASTLLAESSDEGRTVISSFLDGFAEQGVAVGALRGVLDCWSGMLRAYADGQSAVTNAVRQAGEAIPLESASGLGTWAADAFGSLMEGLGLQPAKLDALKPVVLNTAYVARADDGSFGARFLETKERAMSLSGPTASPFASLVTNVEEGALDELNRAGEGIQVAVIELPFGLGEQPLVIALPPAARDAAGGFISSIANGVRGAAASITGVRPWE